MNLNHLHLHVASVDRAADFYARCFGLRPFVRHGEILFMRDDAGMDLALAPAQEVERFPDWFHIGFRLPSKADVEALYGRVASGGAAVTAPLEVLDDFAFFRCLDADGYQIEVYWEPQPDEEGPSRPAG